MDDENPLNSVINPRVILAYLNEIGIRNISGEHLKEFIQDLKKLMKYELAVKNSANPMGDAPAPKNKSEGPERLFSQSTFSSRSKCVQQKPLKKSNIPSENIFSNNTKESKIHVKNDNNGPNLNDNNCQNPNNRNRQDANDARSSKDSCVKPDSKQCGAVTCKVKERRKNKENRPPSSSSSNFIRVPVKEQPKKSDPVSLYHQYSAMWEKYKSHLPGENNWADLRWSVRLKLLGSQQNQGHKVTRQSQENLLKKRNGWVS